MWVPLWVVRVMISHAQPSPSGKLLAAAVFEDSAVVLKEFIMDEATLHGRVISSFALKQWLQAQMRWHPDEKSLLLKLETGSQRHVLARVGLQEGSVKEHCPNGGDLVRFEKQPVLPLVLHQNASLLVEQIYHLVK